MTISEGQPQPEQGIANRYYDHFGGTTAATQTIAKRYHGHFGGTAALNQLDGNRHHDHSVGTAANTVLTLTIEAAIMTDWEGQAHSRRHRTSIIMTISEGQPHHRRERSRKT
jgi:hypothetical protein